MTRIMLVDDHEVLREGIKKAFETAGEEIVCEASNGEQAVEQALECQPDVIIMDISMPVLDGIEATVRIKEKAPDINIVVLTMHDDVATTRRALDAGAVGYVSKGSPFQEVLDTVRAVASGDTSLSAELAESMLQQSEQSDVLSPRQIEILQAIAHGNNTKQVARELGITKKTLHNHLNSAYRKLDAQSLTHAVLSAVRLGIIDLS